MKTADRETIVHETWIGVTTQAQTFGMTRVWKVEVDDTDRRYRTTVRVDRTYPQQTRLEVDLWTLNGWTPVVNLFGEDPAVLAEMQPGRDRAQIASSLDRWLLDAAKAVLA